MQIHAQQEHKNFLTPRMIQFSHKVNQGLQFQNDKSNLPISLTNICMILPIGLPRFSDEHTIRIIQDHKSLSRLETGLRVTL